MAAIKSKTLCNICGRLITNNNLFKHQTSCIKPKIIKERGHKKGVPAWNKGLSKETDVRVKKNGESVSKKWQEQISSGTFIPRKMGNEAREKLSERQSLNNSGGRTKWYLVAGQKVQGTYEKQFAEKMVLESLEWIKIKTNNHIFKYMMDNKKRSYAPDFYIPSMNLYVEIKGYWCNNDETKMKIIREQHLDKPVIVIFGKQKLDYICKNIKNLLPLEPVWSW